MKASRGRIGQYRILKSVESLSKHLIETELFSKSTLFKFLDKYTAVVIKPVFGPGEVCVAFKNRTFQITSNDNVTTVDEKEDLYHHLVCHEINQKYHIIQPRLLSSPFQCYITVHRSVESDEWSLKSVTGKSHYKLGKFFYLYLYKMIKTVVIRSAQKLGEFFLHCNTIVFDILLINRGIWIADSVLHFPVSKWSQYHELTTIASLSRYIPVTELLTEVTLKNFLNKYNEVIMKPCNGQHGIGIVQIMKKDSGTYELHTGRKKLTKSSLEEIYRYMKENYLSKKDYLIQQKLPLASIDDCPLDVRVITQKCNSEWIVTGKLVKVAAKDFIITNAAQKLLTFKDAINDLNISHLNINRLELKIDKICISASRQLENNNAEIHLIGFDIGFTSQGLIWVIEGNYKPDLSMFHRMDDKTIYKNILKAQKD
ncbi:YheC/YheD family protein [Neobacillus sp. NPDC097160]|uniref:YheC/YheD family protein n=1 Tax=Neobacillus sp. NPDC097160 TaxID=3364298 RepID=UPI003821492A